MSFVGHGWRSGTATDPAVNTGAASTATVTVLAPNTFIRKSSITLTVTGTGFTAATVLYANYSPIATTYDSATQLRCTSFNTTPRRAEGRARSTLVSSSPERESPTPCRSR